MPQTEYTLTRRGSITGPIDERTKKPSYHYDRGDVISEAQYKELIARHKDQFELGAKDLNKSKNPKQKAQDQVIADLVERVEALEQVLAEPVAKEAGEELAPKSPAKNPK